MDILKLGFGIRSGISLKVSNRATHCGIIVCPCVPIVRTAAGSSMKGRPDPPQGPMFRI